MPTRTWAWHPTRSPGRFVEGGQDVRRGPNTNTWPPWPPSESWGSWSARPLPVCSVPVRVYLLLRPSRITPHGVTTNPGALAFCALRQQHSSGGGGRAPIAQASTQKADEPEMNRRVTDFRWKSLAMIQPICILMRYMDMDFAIRLLHIDGLIGRLVLLLRR